MKNNKFLPEINTINDVVEHLLCTSCGGCAGICPRGAVKMVINKYGIYVPHIDREKCNGCLLCMKVCPGHSFDYVKYQKDIFGSIPQHIALGNHKEVYAGYTRDNEVLEKCQSGGFVSTVILHCMKKGLIDGAVVTKWKEDAPFEPETYIARKKKEVLAAVGSKYNPVPAAKIIRTILKLPGKYIFVGTSCQIQSLRKAEQVFPSLAEKIYLYLGLHCLGVFTFHFQQQMCSKIRKKKKDIAYFRHRSKKWRGWPCDMRMITKNGEIYNIPADKSRLNPRPYFTAWRCQLCFDKANEFSDISCGDCRIPSMHEKVSNGGYDIKKGLSEFVVRSQRGARIAKEIIDEDVFETWRAESDDVASSIGLEKKAGIRTFMKIARLFKKGIPYYGVTFYSSTGKKKSKSKLSKAWTLMGSMVYYVCYVGGGNNLFRYIMKKIPHSLFGAINKRGKGMSWVRAAKTCVLKLNKTGFE